jgi:hypothetical protein
MLFPAAFDSVAQQPLHHELEVEILHDAKTLRGIDTIHLPRGFVAPARGLSPRCAHPCRGRRHAHAKRWCAASDSRDSRSVSEDRGPALRGCLRRPLRGRAIFHGQPWPGCHGYHHPGCSLFPGWQRLVPTDPGGPPRNLSGVGDRAQGRLCGDGRQARNPRRRRRQEPFDLVGARPSGPLAMFAGRYVVNERMHDKVRIATYFFAANAGLSTRYLDAVQRHIGRYEALHGPYPFAKFAVVENFFPTGYGFPSFTLLGSRVLRLPFIPDTSLRHEVAHCWWGNGVFVDAAGGNWCEGLTTYVADYLSKEEHSFEEARDYRLRTLEKYALLAAGAQDFPLSTFRSRYNPASQAVGYGKAMFVFHMMRLWIGDKAFWAALRDIYAERLYKRTNWGHFMDAFAEKGGLSRHEVRTFHDQWITRPGALQLAMDSLRVVSAAGRPQVEGVLIQKSPRFNVHVPVEVTDASASRRENVYPG